MKKTKHFNISVPELGDVPDITQVSNAISDLEDATAGTLEIMKAEMQGTKVTLTSVSRKTKRTGYYEGMSIRFKSPQDIEPNYLKTISVDGLGDQTLSVEYKVNRNEYIDIVYEGNKFTAYPVVVQKTDSVSNNSSILVGTARGVKTAYDKGVEALNKANQAQSSANNAQSTADGKVSKSGDTMTGGLVIDSGTSPYLSLWIRGTKKYKIYGEQAGLVIHNNISNKWYQFKDNGELLLPAANLATQSKEVVSAINELNSGKENKIDKKSGFNLDKSDSVISNSSNTIATSSAVKTAYDKASQAQSTADGKVSKSGDTMTGKLIVKSDINIVKNGTSEPGLIVYDESSNPKTSLFTASDNSTFVKNYDSGNYLKLGSNGNSYLKANNLKTKEKEVVGAVNEMYDSAFISGDRVKYANMESIHWNAQSGIYKAEQPGATYTMAHFYSGNGSTPAFDLLGRYDEILQYRTARDNNGYSDWYTVATTKHCQEGYVSDIRFGASVYREVYDGPAFIEQSGYVITELINHNKDQYIDSLKARPLQKKKNDMWLTVSFEE